MARKLIAKVKKAKNEQLYSRQQILMKYGLRSSQRMTIDEEINTLIKGMDHDYKRLKGILYGFKDKSLHDGGKDGDYKDREYVAEALQESNAMFQQAYMEQTRKFENAQQNQKGADQKNIDLDEYIIQVSKKLEHLEKKNLMNADSNLQFDSNFGLLQFVYLPQSVGETPAIASFGGSGTSGAADGDLEDSSAAKKGYTPKVLLQHSYFLATMLNLRSLAHFIFDVAALVLALILFLGGLDILVDKGYMDDYHQKWRINLN